jgi:hypothetical protein
VPTFLTDECVTRSVFRAIQAAGEKVVSSIDRYGRGAKDEIWLPDAGKHRLVVITKDEGQKRKPSEIALLIEHCVLHFALTPDHVFTISEQVAAIMKALPEIKRMVQRPAADRGILARIFPDGHVTQRPSSGA